MAEPEPFRLPGVDDPSAFIVHLHHASSMTDNDITDAEGSVGASGLPLGKSIRVGYTISSNQVRYFHSRDAEAAIALAALIDATARDFTNFTPPPAFGTIEVFLTEPVPEFEPPAATFPQAPEPRPGADGSELNDLRDRLILRLRPGDRLQDN